MKVSSGMKLQFEGFANPTTHEAGKGASANSNQDLFLRRLSFALPAELRARVRGGPAEDASRLQAWLGAPAVAELLALQSESDPELFLQGHLRLARSLEAEENYAPALILYETLAAQGDFAEIQARARGRAAAILGTGPVGARGEFLLRRFAREATDPASLLAMGAAGAVFKTARAATLSRLLSAPGAGVLTRGAGARTAAWLTGFSLEAPAFTFSARGLHYFSDRGTPSPPLGAELASSFLFLGGLKLGGLAAERLVAGTARPLFLAPGLRSASTRLAVDGGMLGGILLGHRLEQWAGLRPKLDGATTLTDALAMLLQFKVAGPLTGAALGERFRRYETELELRSRARIAAPPASATRALASPLPAGAPAGTPRREASPMRGLWLAEGRVEGSGRDVEGPDLQDFPKIQRSLFPRNRRFLERHPDLAAGITAHREALEKIDRGIGNRETPGAVPYVARRLAEVLLAEKSPELKLHDHPIAVLLAASLAAHYEELGDLIGHRIYRDLLTVYRLLRDGEGNRYLRAEDIILQNLELDPYNPWFLHLGLQTSLELGELAKFKPSHFLDLREAMEKVPEKWQASMVTRSLEKKLTYKSRRSYYKAAQETSGVYAVILGSLEFLGGLLAFALPSPGTFLKGLFYLQRLGRKVQNTPTFFEDLKRQLSFEIYLYYGDYRNAAPLAAEGSKLPVVQDLLQRQWTGESLEKEIRLEEIPRLHPMSVPQTEALEVLRARLAATRALSLEGLSGSAKTSLAVQLAHELGKTSEHLVFWYSFKEGKIPDLARFFHHLAHFLETREAANERGLLARVQAEVELDAKAALLRSALARNPTVLFLDNFHLVAERPEASRFFDELLGGTWNESRAVRINRRSPDRQQSIEDFVFRKEAMTFEEAEALFSNLGLKQRLSPEQLEAAYVACRGRPMALMLLGELLRTADAPRVESLLGNLAQKGNRAATLKYLFDEVYGALSKGEVSLLQFLAVFREPVPKGILSFFAPGEEEAVHRDLLGLKESFLVEEPQSGFYSVHEKYRRLASMLPFAREEFHRRAAEYYRAHAKFPSDYLEAAHHYLMAGEYDRASKMIAGRVEILWQKGYGDRLETVLRELQNHPRLSPEDKAQVSLEMRNLLLARGQWGPALDRLQEGLAIRRRRRDTRRIPEIYEKMAEAHAGLGDAKKAAALRERAEDLKKK